MTISKERVMKLNRIHDLYKNNCDGCSMNTRTSIKECKDCPIGKNIRSIGSNLSTPRRDKKISAIIAKGQDMTKSDIVFLLENEYTRKEIKKFIGISNVEFNELMFRWELTKKQYDINKQLEKLI
ncbi:zinc-finger domain-containing protein [Metabacillus bambusae]|uniref:Zinc-finger domain-containing protein n=1 Tax=Metabacillus bambusae TaxID=2795218 RepID=A0ABS3N509_9BACI|nr:zinc-finger domain-containing protein [Metabacillus bambusae]MBO1513230.1 zinc-finger domain-containing protein [Metabacillus bambusae]